MSLNNQWYLLKRTFIRRDEKIPAGGAGDMQISNPKGGAHLPTPPSQNSALIKKYYSTLDVLDINYNKLGT